MPALHAADADHAAAKAADGADVEPGRVADRIEHVARRPRAQFLAADDGDAGWRTFDAALAGGGGDHHRIKVGGDGG